VHVNRWLSERAFDEKEENAFKTFLLRRGQLFLQVPAYVPLREEVHFPPQQGLVVGRQPAGARRKLPAQQRLGGVREKRGRVRVVERFEVRARAKVGEQEKSLIELLRDDLRRVHAGCGKHVRHAHEGSAILPVGWRVHRHVGPAIRKRRPPVASETCILRGRGQLERNAELRGEPALEDSAPQIAVYH
jgi:hypothetical protein